MLSNAPLTQAIDQIVSQLGIPIFEGTYIPPLNEKALKGPLVKQDEEGQDDEDYEVNDEDLQAFDRIDDHPWYMVFT